MNPNSHDILNRIFEIKENEGEDKVTSLSDAIARHVKPENVLQVQWQAGAAISEILRQFAGTNPGFTLVSGTFSGYLTNLVHAGLVRKLLTSTCTHLYPKPGPIKPIQSAFRNGDLEIEFWSLCAVEQRMQAAAQGLPFIPISSLKDSNMAEDNRECYILIEDPFGSGEKVGVVKALAPDVSIVHCIAADRYGNAIPFDPLGECFWGLRASKRVIVTTEKLVSTDFIRRHAHMVKLPGFLVDAVVVAPFGAHPNGISNYGLPEFKGYGEDFPFMLDYRKATGNADSLNAWLKEWVFGCPDHQAYLTKVGQDRLESLIGRNTPEVCRQETQSLMDGIADVEGYNQTEMMIIAAARKIRETVLQNGYKTMQFSIGTASLSVLMAYYRLRDEDYGVDLINGLGDIGQHPVPPNPYLMNSAFIPSAKMLTYTTEVYTVMMNGPKGSCLNAIGAAQIDCRGNTNTTLLPGNRLLVGAGGANDGGSMCSEIVVVSEQSADKFVEKVPYISCPGDRVKTLVSDRGIFQKDANGEFVLAAYYSHLIASKDERIKSIRDNCGWELKISDKVSEVEPPSPEELTLLRLLDPRRLFIGNPPQKNLNGE